MMYLLAGIAALVVTGGLAGACGRLPRTSALVAIAGNVAATALGAEACVRALCLGSAAQTLSLPWPIPFGAFSVRLDALSAFFVLPILVLSLLAALYGSEYMRAFAAQKRVGGAWCFYNLLVASMLMVVLADNGVLFLVAWELMALTSFFLVAFEDEKAEVREAAWIYLVASHIGAAALLALFVVLGGPAQSFEFASFGHGIAPGAATAAFILAVIGFGSKAGFAPLHIWLPEAHPAAPSHVSALMSGLMLKVGIYGLVRVLLCLGAPPLWWGWTLVTIGLVSGVGGVLFAIAQHNLKRLLAYHSIENIGIIAMGIGLGLIGWSAGNQTVCLLGFAGGLLHVINHALFKSLLFLGAGSVMHATHTLDVDRLGGLLKRMPCTGATFLIGSMSISGLPPFNGFVSEFLIFAAAFVAITQGTAAALGAAVAVAAGLALISGLAAACFTKAFGGVFLGEPRADHADHAQDPGLAMLAPMMLLAGACLAIGLGSAWVVSFLAGLLQTMRPELSDGLQIIQPALDALSLVTLVLLVFLGVLGALALLRRVLLHGRSVGATGTWDCGYAAPTARMQYTPTSFAQPLTALFASVLRTKRHASSITGLFPEPAHLSTHTDDVCMNGLYRPLFVSIEQVLGRLRWLQHGNIHLYVLYIAVTLVALLLWKLT